MSPCSSRTAIVVASALVIGSVSAWGGDPLFPSPGFATPVTTSPPEVIDADGDGNLDVFTAGGATGDSIAFHRGFGDTTFAAPVTIPLSLGVGPIVGADFDGDGRGEVVVGYKFVSTSPAPTWMVSVSSAGALSATQVSHSPASLLSVGDLDMDGDLDVVLRRHGESSRMLLNLGAGSFGPESVIAGAAGLAHELHDIDGDGLAARGKSHSGRRGPS